MYTGIIVLPRRGRRTVDAVLYVDILILETREVVGRGLKLSLILYPAVHQTSRIR
jgi:hypothetical protein